MSVYVWVAGVTTEISLNNGQLTLKSGTMISNQRYYSKTISAAGRDIEVVFEKYEKLVSDWRDSEELEHTGDSRCAGMTHEQCEL